MPTETLVETLRSFPTNLLIRASKLHPIFCMCDTCDLIYLEIDRRK